jgi:hypothetical protein
VIAAIPRGTVIGKVGGPPLTEADHFAKCPGCGQWFDMRDLNQILLHFHDAAIEIGEGPEPPARDKPVQ